STSLSLSYSALPAGTWKLPDVPMPMAGTRSPVDGIFRCSSPPCAAALASWVNTFEPSSAAPAVADVRKVRRAIMDTPCLVVIGPLNDRGAGISFRTCAAAMANQAASQLARPHSHHDRHHAPRHGKPGHPADRGVEHLRVIAPM